ncbi:MAG TPA: hypothetical protein VGC92_04040 [Phenylobacterium sp.]
MSADSIDAMDESLEDIGPTLPEEDDGAVVHWMEKPPMKVGWLGLSATAVGAFSLGVVAGMAVFAFSGWLPQREYLITRRRED